MGDGIQDQTSQSTGVVMKRYYAMAEHKPFFFDQTRKRLENVCQCGWATLIPGRDVGRPWKKQIPNTGAYREERSVRFWVHRRPNR